MKSESIKNLAVALVKFQGELTSVPKKNVNPFFKSKYADLSTIHEHIREPLSQNGLAVVQTVGIENDTPTLNTMLVHVSGEWITGTTPLNPTKNDPQGIGSAMTYARRYGLSAILGIASDDDDDGNSASTAQKPVAKKTYPKKTGKKFEFASEKQGGMFFGIAKNDGKHTTEEIKAYLENICPDGKANTKKIPSEKFEQALAWAKTKNTADANGNIENEGVEF